MPGSVELSLVIPVYNERDHLAPLLRGVAAAVRWASYEVVAVDDGSTDGSLPELKRLRAAHPGLRVVAFERNAGQTAALAAGFRAARGAILVTLDADLQNDPADIPALVAALGDGRASAVAGYRVERRDTAWKRLQSRIANGVRNWLNGESIRDTGCSLKAFRADAVRGLPLLTACTASCPRSSGCTAGGWPSCRSATAPGAPAAPSTGCGTAPGARSWTRSPSAGCSAARSSTA